MASFAMNFLHPSFSSISPSSFLHPKQILRELSIERGSTIADFGCGSGYFPIALAKATGSAGRVIAVDVLPSALNLVEGRARNDGLVNIEIRRANLEVYKSSGLDDMSVDLVFLANILHQSYKKAEILKEAVRVVKPGGRIVIIEYRLQSYGVGPLPELRLDKPVARRLGEAEGLNVVKEFDAGEFHYGLIFEK